MYIGFSQPPILASIQSVVDRSCSHSALGIHIFWHTWQDIYLSHCTWKQSKLHHRTAFLVIMMIRWSHLSRTVQKMPRIASPSTMCNSLHHFSRYSIALNLIFTAYTLSPTYPNFLSLLPQLESMPSQLRNHYSQKNPKAHLQSATAFQKAAYVHCPFNVYLPIICRCALYYRWLMSLIALMHQNDDTNQEICIDESEDTSVSASSSDIEEDGLDHHQEVLLLGQENWNKSLQTTRVPSPKKLSRADTIITHPLLPNSCNPPGAMVPPLLKCQKPTLLNKLSQSDHSPSIQALLLPKASGDQNIPQHKKATSEVAKRFMEAILSTRTPWPLLSDDKYLMDDAALKLAIKAQNHQQALAGASLGTPSVCQWPGVPSLKIDPQTQEAASFGFCLMFMYQIHNIVTGEIGCRWYL